MVTGRAFRIFAVVFGALMFCGWAGAGEKDIVNIINFIRAVEPRETIDLYGTVAKQVEIVQEKGLAGTWLIQYDAMCEGKYVELMKKLGAEQEVGGWLEIVQPLVEDAGMEWEGRYPWDWHCNVGFSIGYTPAEREKLVDVFMEKFKEVFGKYPEVVGSWFNDAHTLNYLWEKYRIVGSCICKEQIGTDGYTVWGGYYNHGYYPSKKNMLLPARKAENQIDLPVFRMLGNDPIYAYECFTGRTRGIRTQEPVCGSGRSADWVKWFFDVNFDAPCLSFGYTQAGQENSFGWKRMGEGFLMQMDYIADQAKAGKVQVWTLGRTARWFRDNYKMTPASAITSLKDWSDEGLKSVWYYCRNYRASLLWDGGRMWFRDIQCYDDDYEERYLTEVCTTPDCTYDALAVVDGGAWTDANCVARLEPVTINGDKSEFVRGGLVRVTEDGDSKLVVNWRLEGGDVMKVVFDEGGIDVECEKEDWGLEMVWAQSAETAIEEVGSDFVGYQRRGHKYLLRCNGQVSRRGDNGILIRPEGGKVQLRFE